MVCGDSNWSEEFPELIYEIHLKLVTIMPQQLESDSHHCLWLGSGPLQLELGSDYCLWSGSEHGQSQAHDYYASTAE